MFYPESVLVQRTPGIATIWLMATLGFRQNSKKVSKKAILEVDIPQACDAIHNPQAPMALRLQSNLLYGISRIYSQRCLYILTDAEAAHMALRKLFGAAESSERDPRAGIARPETLIVQDDPAFFPDLFFPVIDFDVSAFDSSGISYLIDPNLSSVPAPSSRSTKSPDVSNFPQLDVPPSDSLDGAMGLNLPGFGTDNISRHLNSGLEDTGLLDDLDFEFDATGNIIDHHMLDDFPRAQFLEDHDIAQPDIPGTITPQENITTNIQSIVQHSNDVPLPGDNLHGQLEGSHDQEMSNESSQYVDISSTSEYAEFTEVRRKRTEGPALPRDRILQISNIVLQQWYNDYVTNMRNARKLKDSRQQFRRAKANAELILLGTGQSSFILSGYMFAEPLLDSAKNLFGHLTGAIGAKNGIKTKRKRHGTASETDSSDSEKRRTKLRADEETEIARGGIENEEGYVAMADDIDPSIEIAREAMTMMEDYSTQLPLPWSGSRAGSVHSARLSRQASVLSSRAIGIGIGTGMRPGSVHSFDRRTSRIPSASPMLSRSIMRRSSGHNHESQSGLDDAGFLPDFESGPDTSPQYHGRSTQDITESQQLHDTFIKESTEFMIWIQNSIDAKKDEDSEETVEQHISVKFEELLPIQQYARAVAAQAFLHVLVLANRNAIKVAQKTADEAGSDLWWATLDISISGI